MTNPILQTLDETAELARKALPHYTEPRKDYWFEKPEIVAFEEATEPARTLRLVEAMLVMAEALETYKLQGRFEPYSYEYEPIYDYGQTAHNALKRVREVMGGGV